MNIKRIRKVALWGALFVAFASIVMVFLPVPPHGRFSTPQVANTADAYFEFSDGKFTTVMFGGESGREGKEYRRLVGEYRKERGRWVLVTPSGTTVQLCATPLSLTIVEDDGRREGPFYRYEIYKGR